MINELRGIPLDILNSFELYSNEIIGIGSEGCIHDCIRKILRLLDMINNKKINNNVRFRIITPRIPQKYMDVTTELLFSVFDKIKVESIVINDYGLLFKLKKSSYLKGFIILGRTLIRTLADVPWNNLIIGNEHLELQKDILRTNILHIDKIQLFKNYKVAGVEISPVKVNNDEIQKLRDAGIKCFVHYNNEIATIGRTCPRLRLEKGNANYCVLNCDKPITLEFYQGYGVTDNIENKGLYPIFYNINNVIYHQQNVFKAFDFQKSDGIIYDYRLCNIKHLYDERKKWRDMQ